MVASTVDVATSIATLSWRQTVREWSRPWKLVTLLLGVALLIWGSFAIPAPDWDIPISIIMALMTYATASWSLRVVMLRAWRWLPLALLYTWSSVDGCYALYWWWQDPQVLALMRDVNFPASLALYGMCGVLWLYQGHVRQGVQQLLGVVRHALRSERSSLHGLPKCSKYDDYGSHGKDRRDC